MKGDISYVVIRKDNWITSKPWCVDIVWSNGTIWKNFLNQYKTLKKITVDTKNMLENSGFQDVVIKRELT